MPRKTMKTIKRAVKKLRKDLPAGRQGKREKRTGTVKQKKVVGAPKRVMRTRVAAQTKKEPQKKKTGGFVLIRGMKDVLPQEQKYWELVRSKVEKLAPIYGFSKIETPILEETALFTRAVGEDTDVVKKEMFSFVDQGGESVCLRPEGTSSVARAYIEHGMLNRPQPVKLWYWGPMFRRGRPQTGRQRQFTQFGFEVIGEPDAVLDSQLIILVYKICEELKIKVSVQINSIGCPECRPDYKKALVDYLKVKKNFLCEDCRERLDKNPLRVLDCKREECQRLVSETPQIVDFLCDECKSHFIKVLEGLDECEIPYNLNSKLVRGLDYYTKTVFEIWPIFEEAKIEETAEEGVKQEDQGDKAEVRENERKEIQNSSNLALGGGGRYDGLVEMIGGREATPATGFAAGIERIILILKKQDVKIQLDRGPDVFLAQLGDQARKVSLKLFEELRKGNIRMAENLSKDGLKPQLEQANRLKVRYALIIGQKEILDRTIIIRDMESGVQEMVDFDKAVEEVKKRLK